MVRFNHVRTLCRINLQIPNGMVGVDDTMFSKLRNFSEDFAKSINDSINDKNIELHLGGQKNPSVQLKNEAQVLGKATPDAESLKQPSDEAIRVSVSDSNNESRDSKNEEIDFNALPIVVRAKLRKFNKYEEKYPVLLEAFKVEKRKAAVIPAIEKVLRENTPISSISEAGALVEYLNGLNEKSTLLQNEIRNYSTSNSSLTKRIKELELRLSESKSDGDKGAGSEATIELLRSDVESLRKENLQHRLDISSYNSEIENHKTRSCSLYSDIKELEDEMESLVLASFGSGLSEGCDAKEIKFDEGDKLKEDSEQKFDGNFKYDLKSMRSKVEALRKRVKDYQDRINNLEKMLENKGLDANKSKTEEAQDDSARPSSSGSANKKKNKKKKKGTSATGTVVPTSTHKLSPKSDQDDESKESDNKGSSLLSELEKKSDIISDLTSHIEQLEKTLNEVTESSSNFLAEKDNLLEENKDRKAMLNQANEEIENLRDLLKLVSEDLVQAKEDIKKSKKEADDLDDARANKNYEEKTALLERDLTKWKSEVDKLADLFENSKKDNRLLKTEHERLDSELKKSHTEHETLLTEKKSLTDRIQELNKIKSNDASLKLEIASLKSSIDSKDQIIGDLKAKVENLEKAKDDLTKTSGRLRSELKELWNKNSNTLSENSTLKSTQKASQEQIKSLTLLLTNLQRQFQEISSELENLKLLQESYEKEKSSRSIDLQSFKQQYDELVMKSKEATKKIESLEDELNESRSLLQEKIRDTSSVRQILLEVEANSKNKDDEWRLRMDRTMEEKKEYDNNLNSISKKKQREIDELKSINENYLSKIQDLENKLVEVTQNYSHSGNALSNVQVSEASKNDYEEARKTIDVMRESLLTSTKKVHDYESMVSVLKKLNEETNVKFERLSKNYKMLSQQYDQLRHINDGLASNTGELFLSVKSPSSTRTSLERTRTSLEQSYSDPETEINIAYLKNVLLGFFEHKEQRNQLLPVIKTLFHFNREDEKKFLVAIK